jgi:hypothetical protein
MTLRQQGGTQEALLCAGGIVRDGRKVLLHLALGQKESHACAHDAQYLGQDSRQREG